MVMIRPQPSRDEPAGAIARARRWPRRVAVELVVAAVADPGRAAVARRGGWTRQPWPSPHAAHARLQRAAARALAADVMYEIETGDGDRAVPVPSMLMRPIGQAAPLEHATTSWRSGPASPRR